MYICKAHKKITLADVYYISLQKITPMKKSPFSPMALLFLILISTFQISTNLKAQSIAISTDGSQPDSSAMLDVISSDKGILIPRLEFNNRPSSPANGLMIYQTDKNPGFYYYNDNEWIRLADFTQADWYEADTTQASFIKNKPVDISKFNNDAGYLTFEKDSSITNEIQVVDKQGYKVSLSEGGGSFMTGLESYSQATIDTMTPYNGLTVHNTTTNCINYYYLNNWFESCGTCTPQPSQALAGDDQTLIGFTTSTTLEATTPEVGTGLWTVFSGQGGVFDAPSNPHSLFSGLQDTIYILQWSVSTTCDTVTDEVNILFANPQVGDEFQGGIVAYILQRGDPGYISGEVHGLIAAPNDQSSHSQWGCYMTYLNGTSVALGSGATNTTVIVTKCSTSGIAAQVCNNLQLNGYNDWFLPSKNELNKLYINKDLIGIFADDDYWSSSERDDWGSWKQDFENGPQQYDDRRHSHSVRAVRAF